MGLSQLPQPSGVCLRPEWLVPRPLAFPLTEVPHLVILPPAILTGLGVMETGTERSQTDTGTETGETGGAVEAGAETGDGVGPETEAVTMTGSGTTTETGGGTGTVRETGRRLSQRYFKMNQIFQG